MRRRAVAALTAHKQEGLQQLKSDPDEMLRGSGLSFSAALPCSFVLRALRNCQKILHLFAVGTSTALNIVLRLLHGVIFCWSAVVLHLQVIQPEESQHLLWCGTFVFQCQVHCVPCKSTSSSAARPTLSLVFGGSWKPTVPLQTLLTLCAWHPNSLTWGNETMQHNSNVGFFYRTGIYLLWHISLQNIHFDLFSFFLCLCLYQADCTAADVMYRGRLEPGGRACEHGQCL